MSQRTIRREVKNLVFTSITRLDPLQDIAFDNQSFVPPSVGDYAIVNVLFALRDRADLGINSFYRVEGRVSANIFSPGDTSTEIHDDIVEEFLQVLTDVDLPDGTRLLAAESRTVGKTEGYYLTQVTCGFISDE